MFLLLVFIQIAFVSSFELDNICSPCNDDHKTCYNVSHILDIEAPFRNTIVINKLGILRKTNTLFYSFEPIIDDDEYYKIGFTNLDNPVNSSVITGGKQIMNFGTFDFDQESSLVYLGGSDGIYVLDTNMNRVSPYSSRGDTVLSLFFKGHVYFVRDGEFKVVKKKGDNFEVLFDGMPVRTFVINKYNVIVFLSTYGMFAYKKDETVWLSRNAYYRGLAVDLDDNIYAWWIDGIYKIVFEFNFTDSRMIKVADVPGMGALTFDNDNNFLFTAGRSLFKLIEMNTTVCS